jgi:hypothetical protein
MKSVDSGQTAGARAGGSIFHSATWYDVTIIAANFHLPKEQTKNDK